MKKIILYILVISVLFQSMSCRRDEAETGEKKAEIAVFIPGVVAGSPTYEMLADGVKKASIEHGESEVRIIEAGFNQGEWENKLTALAATGSYDFIITSNPAMPEICRRVSRVYPEQKFIVLDGYMTGEENIYTFLYNSLEQAYLIGVMGGLAAEYMTDSSPRPLKAGMIAGQEYPVMNNVLKPGFLKGLRSVNSSIELDFRVVGNWYDASKGAELAHSIYNAGAEVILVIAGGAGQGVVSAAKERGKYVLWFDDNGYAISEGQIIGCAAMKQDKAAYEITLKALEGTLEYGTADIAGVREGYVYFIDDDPIYKRIVPENIREKMARAVDDLKSGRVKLEMPLF